ncbi:hypothetical protein LWI29_007792 [Acer saccharum]|uniref:Uncharacterized protein n=1 Tax=Acer saccharum TaxID=4024 RepID=A0AA39T1C2_ACESA|nr:hypothetical protein LWI29_007792 [Acer saccharum]
MDALRDYCNYKGHGCSKAQACLKKILHVISSIEPPPVKNPSSKSEVGEFCCGKKGFDVDLNQGLVGPFWESTESLVENGDLSACSFVCKEEEEEKTAEGSSDIINSVVDSVEEEEDHRAVKTVPFSLEQERGNDCRLGLLIAAAELISSGDKQVMSHDDDDDEKKWRVDDEDTSVAVVRSKRGRVVPHRYRDSVLLEEPCRKPLKTTKRKSRSRGMDQ